MVVTVTPNPSLDRTLEVEALISGAVLRAERVRVDPGGKGLNVSRALVSNGHPSRAVLPVGGYEGGQLVALLDGLGIEVVPVPIGEALRTNVTVAEPDGRVTKLNAPGPALSPDEIEALVRATVEAATGASWVAGCGSLPPGAPEELYGRLTEALHGAGVRVAVDTSGAALEAAVGPGPDLVKPNAEELAEVTGSAIESLGDVVEGAEKLRADGARRVIVSLGPDGAVLVDEDGTFHAQAPRVTPRSTVGAGDALLAGFLAAGGAGPDALAEGVAWGTAACRLPGTAMPGPGDIERAAVLVGAVDPGRRLGGEEP